MQIRWHFAFVSISFALSYEMAMADGNVQQVLEAQLNGNPMVLSTDFCQRCRCCTKTKLLTWESIVNTESAAQADENVTALPAGELRLLLQLRSKRSAWVSTSADELVDMRQHRLDYCKRCDCCDETNRFDWARFIGDRESVDMGEIKSNWVLLPNPQFDVMSRELLK